MNDALPQDATPEQTKGEKAGVTAWSGLKPGGVDGWDPEDEGFWKRQGKRIAWKNLLISIPALHFAFLVWLLWSAIVVNMNSVGVEFSGGELFGFGLGGSRIRRTHWNSCGV